MIRIVQAISVLRPEENTEYALPIIPASATVSVTTEHGDHGYSALYDLAFRLAGPSVPPILFQPQFLKLTLDDGEVMNLGTTERPVRFTVKEEDAITVTSSWREPR